MPNFAVVSGATVTNVVVAESSSVAEEIIGMPVIETTGEPWVGWVLVDGTWQPPVSSDSSGVE